MAVRQRASEIESDEGRGEGYWSGTVYREKCLPCVNFYETVDAWRKETISSLDVCKVMRLKSCGNAYGRIGFLEVPGLFVGVSSRCRLAVSGRRRIQVVTASIPVRRERGMEQYGSRFFSSPVFERALRQGRFEKKIPVFLRAC